MPGQQGEGAPPPLLLPIPSAHHLPDIDRWALDALAAHGSHFPDSEEARRLVASLLVDMATAEMDDGFSLRLLYVHDQVLVPVEAGVFESPGDSDEIRDRLVLAEEGDRENTDVRTFMRNGTSGIQSIRFDTLDDERSPAALGPLWGAVRCGARRTIPGLGSLVFIAAAAGPQIGAVLSAQNTLQELVTGDFIAGLLPTPRT